MNRFLLTIVFVLFLAPLLMANSVNDWLKDINLDDGNVYIFYDEDGFGLSSTESLKSGHIDIYVGDVEYQGVIWPRQLIGATFRGGGVHLIGLENWNYPQTKRARICKVRYPEGVDPKEEFKKVKEFLVGQLGKPYSFNYFSASLKKDNTDWYCSELARAAIFREGKGVDVGDLGKGVDGIKNLSPVSPRDIWLDEDTFEVARHNELYPIPMDAYRVRNINYNMMYLTLRDALEDKVLRMGDVLFLEEGMYFEQIQIKVPKIKLVTVDSPKGVAKTVIRSDGKGNTVEILSPNVSMEGFTIVGARGDEKNMGVYIGPEAEGCRLSNNIILGNPVGIGVNSSSKHEISDNYIFYNNYGMGILKCYETLIWNNKIDNSFERGFYGTEDDSLCALKTATSNNQNQKELLGSVRDFRDFVLADDFVKMYYRASPALINIFGKKPELVQKIVGLVEDFLPAIDLASFGFGEDKLLTSKMVGEIEYLLDEIESDLEIEEDDSLALKNLIDIFREELVLAEGKMFGEVFRESVFFDSDGKMPAKTSRAKTPKPTYFYLNEITRSKDFSTEDYTEGLFFWYSPTKINYGLGDRVFSSYLGNYWDGYRGKDNNGDGVGDSSYGDDKFPLVSKKDKYILFDETDIWQWSLY